MTLEITEKMLRRAVVELLGKCPASALLETDLECQHVMAMVLREYNAAEAVEDDILDQYTHI